MSQLTDRLWRRLAKQVHVRFHGLRREPTDEEVAEELGLTPVRIREMRGLAEPLSLNSPVSDRDDDELGDFVEDPDAVAPFDAASEYLLQPREFVGPAAML